MSKLVVYCADVGSISLGRFGWARQEVESNAAETGEDITALATALADDLNRGARVSLGFECPLYIPVRDDPNRLTSARPGEGARPWSAGAGIGSLTVGLPQYLWILRETKSRLVSDVRAYLDWSQFENATAGLFLWEAFVSGAAKRDREGINVHVADALTAVESFITSLADVEQADALEREPCLSLIGAALVRTEWSSDLAVLQQSCVVIRA